MRKAQAAMEFLMTYGWAILVVLAAIGALAYFGVLNPARLAPDTCTIGTGFTCDNNVIRDGPTASDTIQFRVVNGNAFDIADANITISNLPAPCVINASNAVLAVGPLPQGASYDAVYNCDLGGLSAFSATVELDYRRSGETVSRSAGQGRISGQVQN